MTLLPLLHSLLPNRFILILLLATTLKNSPLIAQAFCNAYGDPAATSTAEDIQQCPEGGFVVLGSTGGLGSPGGDMLLMRISDNGEIIWQKTYGGKNPQSGYRICVLEDGFLLGGTTLSDSTGLFNNYLVKTNKDGDIIKEKTIHNYQSWDILAGLTIDTGGNFVTVSNIQNSSGDVVIRKFNPEFTLIWSNTIRGPLNETAKDIALGKSGDIYIAGEVENQSIDIFLAVFSSEGDSLKTTISGTTQQEKVGGIICNPLAEKIIVSATTEKSDGVGQYFLVRYGKDGSEELAIKEFPENQNNKKIGRISRDGKDNYYISSLGISGDYKLISYYSFDLDLNFRCFAFTKGTFSSEPKALIVSNDNSCIITGNTEISPPSLKKVFVSKSNPFNCPFDSSDCSAMKLLVSLENINQSELRVFPNPADKLLQIDWNGVIPVSLLGEIKIEFIDFTGKIYQPELLFNENTCNIYLKDLASSIYTLLIRKKSGDIILKKKIMVNHFSE